jgi:hypothetical protein
LRVVVEFAEIFPGFCRWRDNLLNYPHFTESGKTKKAFLYGKPFIGAA